MSNAGWFRRRNLSGFTLIELMIVILIIGILMSLMLGAIWGGWRSSQLAMARQSLLDIDQALQCYQVDHNGYPAGDGRGSRELVRELLRSGARGLPYLDIAAERIDGAGNLRSTLDPAEFVHYRNNAGRQGDPAVHNRGRVDLWFRDLDGHADGVRNW